MTSSKTRLTPLEKLKQAANLKPIKREVELTNGDIFEFWSTPLTMAERERASKGTKNDYRRIIYMVSLFWDFK
jgi:hypothetical protein